MLTTVAEPKPKMGRKKATGKSKRDDVAVKIDRTLMDKARLVASRRGTTLAEYLTEMVRTPVERDFAKVIRELDPPKKAEGEPK